MGEQTGEGVVDPLVAELRANLRYEVIIVEIDDEQFVRLVARTPLTTIEHTFPSCQTAVDLCGKIIEAAIEADTHNDARPAVTGS